MSKIECKCDYCGKKLFKMPSAISKRNFCDLKCFSLFYKKTNEYILHENYAEIIIDSEKYGQKLIKIDIEDVERCKKYKWSIRKNGNKNILFYVAAYSKENKNQIIRLHRYLMNCPDDKVIDHINHDTLDNRKQNLRICIRVVNSWYRKDNKSGIAGVSYDKNHKYWVAKMGNKVLGCRKDKQKAIELRYQAEREYLSYTQ